MNFSEKLYTLRKKSGISQEQLAEQLGVSRQAVSKWESGLSLPESDKLIALSNYFNVSVDYLVKEEILETETVGKEPTMQENKSFIPYMGIVFCIVGFLCLVVWGILMIVDPQISDAVAGSSAFTLDGRGILLVVCCLLVVFGVFLLLKKQDRR